MRYYVLATDYDGTLAHDGRVGGRTVEALERLRRSGRRLFLVTGRLLADLLQVFPEIELFDYVVAENGAVLYRPADRATRVLAPPPPPIFLDALDQRGVPYVRGHTIVATWEPHEVAVLETIRERGLELQVIFNKGAVMVLPSGINKASGFAAALTEAGLSPHNAVAIGDAENDHAFMATAECAVAVANALPAVKARADWVTPSDHGEGVSELAAALLADDLHWLEPALARHDLPLGERANGSAVTVPAYGRNLLVCGASGGGKSTFATGILERLQRAQYQFCVIDPEGDYGELAGAVILGDAKRVPAVEEVMELLAQPAENVVVNLLGVARENRPAFFARLFPALVSLRAPTGRPHWILVDEAHHLLPAEHEPAAVTVPEDMRGLVYLTVYPTHLTRAVLDALTTVIIVGPRQGETLHQVAEALNESAPAVVGMEAEHDAIAWLRRPPAAPFVFRSIPPDTERRRHQRKYATGELGEDKSFYFRGPTGRLNLRAQNLMLFLQLADGIDDETWLHHLHRGDYSAWFKEAIKDPGLARAVAGIERSGAGAAESRARIRAEIEHRYTAPA